MANYFSNKSEEEIAEFHELVAKNVKRIRLERKKTAMDISLDLGFRSGSFIASAESSKNGKKFSLEQLFKLSGALNVPIEDFFAKDK